MKRIYTVRVLLLLTLYILSVSIYSAELKVLKSGLGAGTVSSSPAGIDCGATCNASFGSVSVTLTVTADAGSTFAGWNLDPDADPATAADCTGASTSCTVDMSTARSVRPVFDLSTAIPTITDFTPAGLDTYLTANPSVTSTARFIKALPEEFKKNWMLMSRSESLQTGTAKYPRILLPSADARFVFSIGPSVHSSFPGAHPNAIEYMQWDAADKNFRFHEIVLEPIAAMGSVPARTRGISIDDDKCSKCHSTRNVLNAGPALGTNGIPPGSVKVKNKPNWDAYDSWAGMLPFNRDKIYQGSVEAAALRKILNPWTWNSEAQVRQIIEQLRLQPASGYPGHAISRINGGANDGHIIFGFDTSPPVLTEPAPVGSTASISTNYGFNGQTGSGTATSVTRGGEFIILQHPLTPTSSEGRGVQLFDILGGLDGDMTSGSRRPFNAVRIADELISHRFATGSVPIDIRPVALAVTKGCFTINTGTNTVTGTATPLTIDLGFFNTRNGMGINELVNDTRTRAESLTRRKADLQKMNFDRLKPDGTRDEFLDAFEPAGPINNGLIQEYGAATSQGTTTDLSRLRQEVFRRPNEMGSPDATVMGGIYVDRELYSSNTNKLALYRYFLEPLGVSVDKWSMGVRGRSRTYTFADVFGAYTNVFTADLEASLNSDPVPGLAAPFDCTALINSINTDLASALPPADAVPTYTDVQRVFNKGCIECHGGLDYPPFSNFGFPLDLSENENPVSPEDRLDRSHAVALGLTTTDPRTSYLYQRICPGASSLPGPDSPCAILPAGTPEDEDCPYGIMPCYGPRLSHSDLETVRRWIAGTPSRPNTRGDPHIKTVEGINYDFQAAGEYVLLRGQGLEVQARQTAVATDAPLGPNPYTGLTSCVSVNTAAAVRVGPHRITYQPGLNGEPDPKGLQLRLDGELVSFGKRSEIDLPAGGRIIRISADGGIQIEAPGGTKIVLTPGWWNHYQLWYLNIDMDHVRGTQGLMGAIPPGSWLPALPDGSQVGPKPKLLAERYHHLYNEFGNAWRVSNSNTLFDYAPGTSTANFTIAQWPNGESPQSCVLPPQEGVPHIPPVQVLPLEVAQQHCGGVKTDDARANCIQDVRVTGEPQFAKTYIVSEMFELNKTPAAPVLIAPDQFSEDLALPITFDWNVTTDADGDPLTYRFCLWKTSDTFTFKACEAKTTPPTLSKQGMIFLVVVIIIGILMFVLLRYLGVSNNILKLVAVIIVIVIILIFVFCSGSTMSKSKSGLESGKSYYWKVIAEDGNGGTVESSTRRFTVK